MRVGIARCDCPRAAEVLHLRRHLAKAGGFGDARSLRDQLETDDSEEDQANAISAAAPSPDRAPEVREDALGAEVARPKQY